MLRLKTNATGEANVLSLRLKIKTNWTANVLNKTKNKKNQMQQGVNLFNYLEESFLSFPFLSFPFIINNSNN